METTSTQYVVEMTQATQHGDDVDLPDAHSDKTAQFQQLMSNANNSSESVQIGALSIGQDSNTMGDRILDGLQGMKTGYDEQVNAVQDTIINTETLNAQDMLKLQLDLAKLTMQGELINKTVSKSTQNIDTLLKSQ